MKEYKPNKYAEEQNRKTLRTVEEDRKHPISYEEALSQQKAFDLQIEERLKKESFDQLDKTNDAAPKRQSALHQDIRGAYSQGVTYFSPTADISTVIHEDHHHFLDLIDRQAAKGNVKALEHKATIDEFAASDEGMKFWGRKRKSGVGWALKLYSLNDPTFRQELFAESAEKYFSEGKKDGFSEETNEMFERFKVWLNEIYKGKINTPLEIQLSPKIRRLFDSMYVRKKD